MKREITKIKLKKYLGGTRHSESDGGGVAFVPHDACEGRCKGWRGGGCNGYRIGKVAAVLRWQ